MSTKRNFKDFFEKSGVAGVKNVALSYAYGNDTVTFSSISDNFSITERAVQHCIKHAIINCICSYKDALLIKEKAHRNQLKHMKETSVRTTSDKYYESILRKRLEFIKNIPDERVIEFVYLYMSNPNLSCKEIANSLNFSSKEVNAILIKAITSGIIDEKTIHNIVAISLMKSKTIAEFDSRCEYFKKLNKFRKNNVTK